MDSSVIERAAQAAYEAHRAAQSEFGPGNGPWEHISDAHKTTWRQVAEAVLRSEDGMTAGHEATGE